MADDDSAHLGFSANVSRQPGRGTAVTIYGEVDIESVPRLRVALDEAIEAEEEVELDMRMCSFIDSTGIAVLVTAARKLGEDGRTLRIRGVRERVRGILELAGLVSQRWIVLEDEPPSTDEAAESRRPPNS